MEATDRQRNELLKKLASQESKVRAVEPSQAMNALVVQVTRGQFENLSQFKSHLDALSADAKSELAAQLQQLPLADDAAIKLGMRLNGMFAQVDGRADAALDPLAATYTGALTSSLNLREVLDYIRSKYPNTPLTQAAGYVMREFSADLDSFSAGRGQQARVADNAKYVFALAGLALTRLILGVEVSVAALVKGGENNGIRAF
ncbi:hypothetical protein [Pseudomonas fontis]|uniref:Uncharacterized protein n=1 Tax=Pseudomonas fontis TaxID=2942633 RepID=A0ABT5NZU0_9PSED|nr:hypothetical protein [Pseudomonas fontis]MDD0976394.1 hypothetical protein [Pseudomonas fontis]MDD0993720.1 hypothetical protein [Pseudomonas fontis]